MKEGFNWQQFLNGLSWEAIVSALAFFVIGLLLARTLSGACVRVLKTRLGEHHLKLLKRFLYYTILIIFTMAALQQLHIKLSFLLGAAGILTVAVGFAAQTSVSNIISGLFLIAERPFKIGDSVKLSDGTIGTVLSVDLLSIKLVTADNLFVRVPNENLIKMQLTNLTHFPTRRFDLHIGIGYDVDIAKVKQLLTSIASNNPYALEKPEPIFSFLTFGDSAIQIQFSIWAKQEHFAELKNSLQETIKTEFKKNAIDIPYPIRTLKCDPLAIKLEKTQEP